jgi:glycosyltransferase involved in cell wall biosynthesis
MHKALQTYQKGKLSIIIPVYNRALLLPETLDSILAQTYVNWECILVDDGSTDDSLFVCNSYARQDSRFKVFSRPASIRKGANGCRNFGFHQTSGEFIQWFDSDDLMHVNLIEYGLSSFQSKTDMVIFGSCEFVGPWNGESRIRSKPSNVGRHMISDILSGEKWFGTPQVLFRKRFLFQKKIFDNDLARNQETEFFVRILLQNPVIHTIDYVLVNIRKHNDSISGNYLSAHGPLKLEIDFPAFKKIYLNCVKMNALNDELKAMFNDFFFRCLKKMRSNGFLYTQLIFFGIYHSVFPSNFKAIKIFTFRVIESFYNSKQGKKIFSIIS